MSAQMSGAATWPPTTTTTTRWRASKVNGRPAESGIGSSSAGVEGGDSSESAEGQLEELAMRLVTANIKCNPRMRQSRVEHDIIKVKGLGGIILWQEIEIPRYKEALKYTRHGEWAHTSLETEIPISVNTRYWTVLKSGYRLTHHGRKLTTPNRYVSWALVENKL